MFKKLSLFLFSIILSLTCIGALPVSASELYELEYNYYDNLQEDGSYIYTAEVSGITAESEYDYLTVKIPETVKKNGNKYTVNAIGVKAFAEDSLNGKVKVEKVILSNTIETIKESAFAGNTTLQNVFNFQSVKIIEDNAFCGCTALKNIKLESKLKVIGVRAFAGCKTARCIDMSGCSSLVEIKTAAFSECASLQVITFPENLKVVGDSAFEGCRDIRLVNYNAIALNSWGDNVLVKKSTFDNKPSSHLNIGKEVSLIPDNFPNKHGFNNGYYVFPPSVKYIGENVFSDKYGQKFYYADSGLAVDIHYGDWCSNIYYTSEAELPLNYVYTFKINEETGEYNIQEVSPDKAEQLTQEYIDTFFEEEKTVMEENNIKDVADTQDTVKNNNLSGANTALIIVIVILSLIIVAGIIAFILYTKGYF